MKTLDLCMQPRNFTCAIHPTSLLFTLLISFFALSDVLAQECNVSGGTIATTSTTSNICLNDEGSHPVELTVSGNVGIGRFGLVQAGTGTVVAVNTSGFFNMINYPPGNYQAGHVSVQDVSTFAGVTNVNQLMGCYDLSNFIAISSIYVDGGSIAALGSTFVEAGTLEFEVTGASGPNLSWGLLNEELTEILTVQTQGIYDFDGYPEGIYRVVHAAYGPEVNPDDVDPQNLAGCIDVSNKVVVVLGPLNAYPVGTVHCIPGGAEVVEVLNPTTDKTWMDRNLGASQVATASNDPSSYGDLYQWGRFSDGHQCRNSETTTTIASTASPNEGNSWDGKFIVVDDPSFPDDWFSPQTDNLWQGALGINNPCPSGYRLPTLAEWNEERQNWSSNDSEGAFASPLKLAGAGFRFNGDGFVAGAGYSGYYWSSTVPNINPIYLTFNNSDAKIDFLYLAIGHSVRCIKD